MLTEVEALLRIAVAAGLGAALGFERELRDKPAGLRTHMLVAEGSALFMVGSLLITQTFSVPGAQGLLDPTRIGSTIVTGVGFLGGGMILKSGDRVYGLTTAAGIWVAAAIGMLVGAGYYIVSIFGTGLAIITIVALGGFESRFGRSDEGSYDTPEDEES